MMLSHDREEEGPMAVDLERLRGQLQDFSVAHYGREAMVSQVETMLGHGGLSFGFRVDYQENRQAKNESLVRRSGERCHTLVALSPAPLFCASSSSPLSRYTSAAQSCSPVLSTCSMASAMTASPSSVCLPSHTLAPA